MKLPQLAIRDLFWLIALVGLALGWWLDRAGLRESYAWLEGEIQRQGGRVEHFPEPPAGFPDQIALAEAESFLESAPATREQGCGNGRWEGSDWSTYYNKYDSPVKTPWVKQSVSLGSAHTYGEGGNHLMYVTLDGVYYRRASRSEPYLRWQHRWMRME